MKPRIRVGGTALMLESDIHAREPTRVHHHPVIGRRQVEHRRRIEEHRVLIGDREIVHHHRRTIADLFARRVPSPSKT